MQKHDENLQKFIENYGLKALIGKKFIGKDKGGLEREAICIDIDGTKAILNFSDEKGYPYDMDNKTIKLKEI